MSQEQPSVDTICKHFEDALQETRDTEDYLSYATLLDYHLSNPSIYNDEEKTQLLKSVHDILSSNIDILEEIGWDLPELFLRFYNNEFDYIGSLLTDTQLIKIIMKNFDLLAKHGNPKELFLKSTELITALDLESEDEFDADERFSKILDIKLHTLIELMSACLKRINTIYPSRFLSMAIASLLNVSKVYFQRVHHFRFIVRRLYSFARDYIPPSKPSNYLETYDITIEEANTIEEDEDYLQGVLLRSFLTQVADIAFQKSTIYLSIELFKSLQVKMNKNYPLPTDQSDEDLFTSAKGLFSRITQLALSFDIDLSAEFENIKSKSLELMSKIDSKLPIDDQFTEVLKISIADQVSYNYHENLKSIPINQSGLLIFCTQYTKEISKLLPIKINEAIALTLRFLSPSLINPKSKSTGLLDSVMFWCWTSIVNSSSQDFKSIPNYQLILFLQILIFSASTAENPSLRIVIFTLLTRVLSTIDESTSYQFLIDTLATAPYPNAKIAIISILKDLILKVKPINNYQIDLLAENLKKSDISKKEVESKDTTPKETEDEKTVSPPALPNRHYIELNNERIDEIYSLIRESIDETFVTNNKSITIDEMNFKTLLTYLNFLIGINSKFPIEKTNEIIKHVELKIDEIDIKDNEEISDDPSVNIDFIKLALDSLKRTETKK